MEILAHILVGILLVSPIFAIIYGINYYRERKHSKQIMEEFESYKILVDVVIGRGGDGNDLIMEGDESLEVIDEIIEVLDKKIKENE